MIKAQSLQALTWQLNRLQADMVALLTSQAIDASTLKSHMQVILEPPAPSWFSSWLHAKTPSAVERSKAIRNALEEAHLLKLRAETMARLLDSLETRRQGLAQIPLEIPEPADPGSSPELQAHWAQALASFQLLLQTTRQQFANQQATLGSLIAQLESNQLGTQNTQLAKTLKDLLGPATGAG